MTRWASPSSLTSGVQSLSGCLLLYASHYDDPKSCSSLWNPFLLSVIFSYLDPSTYYMVPTVITGTIYILCLLKKSVSFSGFNKIIHILYVGSFMSSFRVHPWPVHMWSLKRKGIFASRYYSHVAGKGIDLFVWYKYYSRPRLRPRD